MTTVILCVGKLKEAYWRDAAAEYTKRLQRFGPVSIIELPDLPEPKNASEADIQKLIAQEGEAMLAQLKPRDYVVALCIDGKQRSSIEFAADLSRIENSGAARAVYAIGDNEAAARASGINVDRIVIKVFGLSSVAASLAGFVALIRLKFGQASLGDDQMFPCITALVVGGTSLSGGKGGMLQTMVGILIYMELLNFLTIIGVDANYKKALQGIIIIVAVALTLTRDRKTIAK